MASPLNEGDRIVVAWAESASGPGWSNMLTRVLVRSSLGALRLECIQVTDYDDYLSTLHHFSALAARTLTDYVAYSYRWPESAG